MSHLPIPEPFSSFNARGLSPNQVADTFVPSAYFQTLAKDAHTQVVGPRGSGKTTLLKMLQPSALRDWKHPDADHYRKCISFAGIYIPADQNWNSQLESLQSIASNTDRPIFAYAAFTTHVLRCVVQAFQQRLDLKGADASPTFLSVPATLEKEAEVVRELAAGWRIKPGIPSLNSLRNSLARRLLDIHDFANREAILGEEGQAERIAAIDYIGLDFLSAVGYAIEVFDNTFKTAEKWALLFDELELAPNWVVQPLLAALRNQEQKMLFKLSLSPYAGDPFGAMAAFQPLPTHDYDVIRLWFPNKEDGYTFSRDLIESMMFRVRSESRSAREIFGTSIFESDLDPSLKEGAAYGPGSKQARHFRSLYAKDPSFKKYCDSRGIDPSFKSLPDGIERAALVRKVVSLVIVRDLHLAASKELSGKGRRRSRKNPELYYGDTSIFAVSEGNPRWLKAIVTALIQDQLGSAGQGLAKPVSRARQGIEIHRANERFRALLKSIPSPSLPQGRNSRGLLTLIDSIGKYFRKAVIEGPFSSEPSLSFTVDARTDVPLTDALGKALNAGAIIWVPDDAGESMLTSVRSKRFRLSYLLATQYGLPLTLGNSISLSTILASKSDSHPTLFNEDEA